MHVSLEVKRSQVAKPEIIQYNSQTKGGIGTMKKMLENFHDMRRP